MEEGWILKQIQTEELKRKLISELHYKVREEEPKVFNQPSLTLLLSYRNCQMIDTPKIV